MQLPPALLTAKLSGADYQSVISLNIIRALQLFGEETAARQQYSRRKRVFMTTHTTV